MQTNQTLRSYRYHSIALSYEVKRLLEVAELCAGSLPEEMVIALNKLSLKSINEEVAFEDYFGNPDEEIPF